MKVVLLAGGYATRLWPITKNRAKPLLPLGRQKIIDFVYEKAKGFGEILISTNKRFEDDFRNWAKEKDVKIVAENTRSEEEKLGAVRALAYVTEDIEDDVFVIAADNVFDFDLEKMVDLFKKNREVVVALYDVGDLEMAKRYGVAEVSGEKIVNFEEKPPHPKSSLIGVAIYLLPQDTLSDLQEYVESNRKKDNLGDFIAYLCKKREVLACTFNGNWYDIGTPDSYLEALKTYMSNYIAKDVEISRASKIIEPVVIESGVKISGRSIIGPYTYIASNCVIESCDISESVIFERNVMSRTKLLRCLVDDACEIRNIELSSSIIGGHAKIQRG
ncbi:MAG: NDP-sugar synthase [Archaeoglobaceae archaeon]